MISRDVHVCGRTCCRNESVEWWPPVPTSRRRSATRRSAAASAASGSQASPRTATHPTVLSPASPLRRSSACRRPPWRYGRRRSAALGVGAASAAAGSRGPGEAGRPSDSEIRWHRCRCAPGSRRSATVRLRARSVHCELLSIPSHGAVTLAQH